MNAPCATAHDVAHAAARLLGCRAHELVPHVVELDPHETLRTFRVKDLLLRVDEDADGDAVAAESLVLETLSTAAVPPLAPQLCGRGHMPLEASLSGGGPGVHRAFLACRWIAGSVLDAAGAVRRVKAVGQLFARLHGARVMDLFGRLARQRPLTLLPTFRLAAAQLRGFVAARELDGLGPDALTRALLDLQSSMRDYCIAQDHLFLTARRRVLCHGRLAPRRILVPHDRGGLLLLGFESACLGDAAEDLARFALAAGLDAHAQDALLHAYLEALDEHGRSAPRFLPRYCARRTLALFAQPVARLSAMVRLKRGELRVLGDPAAFMRELERAALEELARAMNGLRELTGQTAVVTTADVAALGRFLPWDATLSERRASPSAPDDP